MGHKSKWITTNIIISAVMKTGKETIVRYVPAIPIQVVAKTAAASR